MNPRPLVTVDESYDRHYASDGISRFGAYVRQRAHLFVDDWEPLSPVTFAATVWAIATGPVMSPAYVHSRRDITSVACRNGDEPGVLIAEVNLCLAWPLELTGALDGWTSWQRLRDPDEDEPRFAPPLEDRPALLLGAQMSVPIKADQLPGPSRFAALDVAVAKRAVGVVCRMVNEQAGPVVDLVRAAGAVGDRR